MIFKDDRYILPSGRSFHANCGILGLGLDDEPDHLYDGYDGGTTFGVADDPLSPEDRAAIADEMIRRWTAWKENK